MIKTVVKWNFDKILMRVEAAQKLQELVRICKDENILR